MKVGFVVPLGRLEEAERLADAFNTAVRAELAAGRNPCFNPAQALLVEGDLLVYEGQRHPFLQDGALGQIANFFGAGIPTPQEVGRRDREAQALDWARGKSVALYETTDPRLEWWQTLQDLPFPRVPLELFEG